MDLWNDDRDKTVLRNGFSPKNSGIRQIIIPFLSYYWLNALWFCWNTLQINKVVSYLFLIENNAEVCLQICLLNKNTRFICYWKYPFLGIYLIFIYNRSEKHFFRFLIRHYIHHKSHEPPLKNVLSCDKNQKASLWL